jgi:putative hydrolase of the HAD superfamily/5'-nucleotidase
VKKYDWILFDADNTLFHFDAYKGLKLMFSQFGVEFTEHDYQEYESINQPLWVQYQKGEITAQYLQKQRFNSWAEKLTMSSIDLNHAFLCAMTEISHPLEGAISLLENLKGKSKLGIITNGFAELLQQARLERTGIKEHIDLLVMSEKVGVAKPHRDIFEHALAAMGNPDRDQVLMVGDNLDSDIIGGINVGVHTCWLNADQKIAPPHIIPHYEVPSLADLERLLLK